MVGDDGELKVGVCDLVDVLDPTLVRPEVVGALSYSVSFVLYLPRASIAYQANHLNATSIKFVLQLGKGTKLSSADGCVVSGMRKQNCPAVTNPLVEGLDVALILSAPPWAMNIRRTYCSSLCAEVRGNRTKANARLLLSCGKTTVHERCSSGTSGQRLAC